MASKTSALSPLRYLIAETILLLVFSYLFIFASTQNGLITPVFLGITAGLFTLLAVFAFVPGPGGKQVLSLPVLVFLLVLAGTAFFSIDPRRSLAEAWLIAVPFFLAWIISSFVRRGWPGELFIKCILIVGAMLMAFSWGEAVLWYLRWLQTAPGIWIPELTYRLPVPNFLGVVLNIFLMMALARLFSSRSKLARVLLGFYSLSALGLLYLTSSRGGWVGTAAGLAAMAVLLAVRHREVVRSVVRKLAASRILIAGLVVMLLVVLSAGAWLLASQTNHPTHVPVVQSRSYLWKPAWDAFLQSPIVGRGLHTYVSFFLQAYSCPPDMLFVYSHSVYLDLLSGSGLVGFAAFIWLVVILAKQIGHRLKTAAGLELAGVTGAAAALAAFGVHGFFDSVHHTVPTCLWLITAVCAAALSEPQIDGGRPVVRWIPAVGGLLIAAGAWFNLWLLQPMAQGSLEANTGYWPAAAEAFSEAARRDPTLAAAHQQAGLAYSVLAKNGDPASLDRAIAEFEQAVVLDPYWSYNHANLAALYLSTGETELALAEYRRAIELAPGWALFHLKLAEAEELAGHLDAAVEAYSKVLEIRPGWRVSSYWKGSKVRQDVLAGFDTGYPQAVDPSLAELEQSLAASTSDGVRYLPVIKAYLDSKEYERAAGLVRRAELAVFGNEEDRLVLYTYAAWAAAAQGDSDAAAYYRQLAETGFQYQGSYGPGTFGLGSYGSLMFRRPAMLLEIVPQFEIPDLGAEGFAFEH